VSGFSKSFLGRLSPALLAIALAISGCASGPRVLMPTPNLYAEEQGDAFTKLAQPLKTDFTPGFWPIFRRQPAWLLAFWYLFCFHDVAMHMK
jgi:hypothetical protein